MERQPPEEEQPETPCGRMLFEDGVQPWLNPGL
jgi:hypothetical protein